MSVKVDTRVLDSIIAKEDKNADKAIRAVGFALEGHMKVMATKDTSAMANSVYTETGKGSEYSNAAAQAQASRPEVQTEQLPNPGDKAVNVGPCVEYAEWVEFGNDRWAGKPFVIPAAEKVLQEISKNPSMFEDLING